MGRKGKTNTTLEQQNARPERSIKRLGAGKQPRALEDRESKYRTCTLRPGLGVLPDQRARPGAPGRRS